MFIYSIWGTDIVSDIELDLNDKETKNKLVEARMMVDRSGAITDLFLIRRGTIKAFPDDKTRYHEYLSKKGEAQKDFHEENF
jgi:hypothetical protein